MYLSRKNTPGNYYYRNLLCSELQGLLLALFSCTNYYKHWMCHHFFLFPSLLLTVQNRCSQSIWLWMSYTVSLSHHYTDYFITDLTSQNYLYLKALQLQLYTVLTLTGTLWLHEGLKLTHPSRWHTGSNPEKRMSGSAADSKSDRKTPSGWIIFTLHKM